MHVYIDIKWTEFMNNNTISEIYKSGKTLMSSPVAGKRV